MAITKKLTKHESCTLQVEWLDPTQQRHYARLVCIDPNCKHKFKWIQWLNLTDAITLVEDYGIAQTPQPAITAFEEPW